MQIFKRALTLVSLTLASYAATAAEISLYATENFGGTPATVNRQVDNLTSMGFNDKTRSIVIKSGDWQVCDDADFRGRCVTMQPGRYPSLAQFGLDRKVSSVRPVVAAPPPPPPPVVVTPPNWGSQARVILFERPNLSGRSVVVQDTIIRNFNSIGFNDRVASIRVEKGYWLFCTDAQFEGDCKTFGPGDYPRLPREMKNSLSSGRMISPVFPYSSKPNWEFEGR
jgi:hypothetical protein